MTRRSALAGEARLAAPLALPVGGLVVGLVVALYWPGLARGFVSEDFLIVRRLHDGGWRLALEQLTGPWLGAAFVGFYRPLASAILDAQLALFGPRPAPLLVVQLVVHLLNAGLVAALVHRLARRPPLAVAGAALFALHPLHPNAVLFIASFATLYATTAILAAALFHLAERRGLALLALVASFGCYEQAAVTPILLLALDLARRSASASPQTLVRRHLGYWLGAVGYLIVRSLALGVSVGGYAGFRERFHPSRWSSLLHDLGLDLLLLVQPNTIFRPPTWLATLVALGACGLLGVLGWRLLRRRGPTPESQPSVLGFVGLVWSIAALAPFAFTAIVPANGRYVYLSAVGGALLVVAIGQGLAGLLAGRVPGAVARWIALAPPIVLATGFAVALPRGVAEHVEASATVESMRVALLELPREVPGTSLPASREVPGTSSREASREAPREVPGTVFVLDRPTFLTRDGHNAAQILHWGLADSLRPPFVDPGDARSVVPLPDGFPPASLSHLSTALGDDARLVRWADGRLVPINPKPVELNTIPSRLSVADDGNGGETISYRGEPSRAYRLVLLTAGAPLVVPAPSPPSPTEFVEATPPGAWLDSMRRLYRNDGVPSPSWLWVETLDRDGRTVGASRVYRP